jgi:mono/diheme cytochrome c family protein
MRIGFLTALLLPAALLAEPQPLSMPSGLREFLERHCVSCHRTANAPAGLNLTSLPYDLEDINTFGGWVRIHDQVRDGAMPPHSTALLKPSGRSAFLKMVG